MRFRSPLERSGGTLQPNPIRETPPGGRMPPLDITGVGTSCSGATVGDDGFWFEGTEGEKWVTRSEEHTSELQSLMRISYAVFCLKKRIYILTSINYHYYKHNTTY